MRLVIAIAILCLIQIAIAADPNQGATVLQPSGTGNANKGVSVLTPSGAAPAGGCITGKGCGNKNTTAASSDAPIAAPPAGMTNAIVIRPKGDCGCEKEDLNCRCDKPKYVEPEIKEPPRNCTCTEAEETCACLQALRHHGHHKKRIHETVAPEQSPNHVVPEVREKLHHIPDCANGNPCQQPEFVQPEIKKECPCALLENVECACNSLKPNF